jgi:hypothetical protein
MSLKYQRIRLALETSKPLDVDSLLDLRTNLRARFGYNRALAFEVAVVDDKTITDDIADISVITMVVKKLTAAGVIDPTASSLLEKSVAVTNTNLTQDQWTNDQGATPWHAVFQFNDSETAISMTGESNNELLLGIVFTGLTTAGRVPLASGLITCVNDGAVITGGTPPVVTRTMTDAEIQALLASKVGFTGNPNGSMVELPSPNGKKIIMRAQDETDGSVTFAADDMT